MKVTATFRTEVEVNLERLEKGRKEKKKWDEYETLDELELQTVYLGSQILFDNALLFQWPASLVNTSGNS